MREALKLTGKQIIDSVTLFFYMSVFISVILGSVALVIHYPLYGGVSLSLLILTIIFLWNYLHVKAQASDKCRDVF